ncbi:filamentous hemagglutinin family N-terminal domain-containing protein [Verrucomicrobium sp. GAS474]|uniref:beta strand repeat-containing protein n=1 Tax=Verrucomicrobium sp. GAS474 TaxID=1882831 RepID=UPI00087A1A1D|nr:filamentous hemagglutinin N-terminal domain-containing protein [Verrucomicrobium sp. GAS474]SDT87116.1 filamentous hemagglutinin family N-terminal domain-containing protein [Verrucomicrobium sp. GAS474]
MTKRDASSVRVFSHAGFRRYAAMLQLALVGVLAAPSSSHATDLPTGGTFQAGAGTISTSGNTMNVTTTTAQTVMGWTDFSIGAGFTTNFNQPNSSSTVLNKVTGGNVSNIYGTLSSNGNIILINPNGVLIGPGGVVNTQSFTASTLDLVSGSPSAGTYAGNSNATIVNLGTITANGGDIFLIAKHVSNGGVLKAPNGTVGLAAGTQVTLAEGGDNRVSVRYDTGARDGIGVENTGTIAALKAELVANGNIYSLAVNNTGLIRATGVSSVGGRVRITASGGTAQNSGTIIATNGTKGGEVSITGHDVHLASTSVVDVSGANGGGTAKIGGGAQGEDATLENATNTTIDAGAVIHADATDSGDGGTVVVWADGRTAFSGAITARGGPNGGNGGAVEVSGVTGFDFEGTVNTLAPKGVAGSLLLDPSDLTIYSTSGSASTSGKTVLSWETIQNSLGTNGTLTVQTKDYQLNANDFGGIVIADSFTLNTGANLIFAAQGAITINTGITIANTGSGTLTLRADSMAYGANLPSPATSTSASTLAVGNALGGGGTVTNNGTINWAGKVTIYYDPVSYASPITSYSNAGAGSLTAYMLVNTASDLTAAATAINANASGAAAANYSLNQSIDLASASWTPIGSSTTPFTGIFDGNSKTISNIVVSGGNGSNYLGFFGYVQGGTVSNVTLQNISVTSTATTGTVNIGGLIGYADSAKISGVSFSGSTNTVTSTSGASSNAGGLVGVAAGTTSVSGSNNASVSGGTAGGLVGYLTGTSTVTGSNSGVISGTGGYAGGLAGYVDSNGALSSLTNNAAGTVTASGGSAYAGGIFGYLSGSGTVSNLSNAGAVNGDNAGGLFGYLDAARTATHGVNSGAVTGTLVAGGLAAIAANGSTITNSYNTGTVSGAGMVGGVVGDLHGTINYTYNSGLIQITTGQTGNYLGGLVGTLESDGLIENSFNAGTLRSTSGSSSWGTATYAGALVGNNLSVNTSLTTTTISSSGSSSSTTSTDTTGAVSLGSTTSTSAGTTTTTTTTAYAGIWTSYYGSGSYSTGGISSSIGTSSSVSGATAGDSGYSGTFASDSSSSSWYSTTTNWTSSAWQSSTVWNLTGTGLPTFIVSGGGGGGGGSGNHALSGDPNATANANKAALSSAQSNSAGIGTAVYVDGIGVVVLPTVALQPQAPVQGGNGTASAIGSSTAGLGGDGGTPHSLAFTPVDTGDQGNRQYAPIFDSPTLPGALQHVRPISTTSNEGVSFGHPTFGGTHSTMSYTDPNH